MRDREGKRRKWRTSASMEKAKEHRKRYNDTGVTIDLVKSVLLGDASEALTADLAGIR